MRGIRGWPARAAATTVVYNNTMFEVISVYLENQKEPLEFPISCAKNAESLCIQICRHEDLAISPLTRTLFALRIRGSNIYLKDDALLEAQKQYEFRFRFKVRDVMRLKLLNERTFNYLFWQVRNDVLESQIPEIRYPAQKNELFGLGLTDMYRALKEGENLHDLLKNLKEYIHKDILKNHLPFTKKPLKANLSKWNNNPQEAHTIDYIKMEYLKQAMFLAPNYLSEEYSIYYNDKLTKIHINPYHKEHPGLYIQDQKNMEFVHVCTLEELCFVGRMSDNNELVINRSNNLPIVIAFTSDADLSSFISCCSGYYRLMVKWTFNLSRDDLTPSLEYLLNRRWHGPVGGDFSYMKLETVAKRIPGSFIVRECEKFYDTYYIDVCTCDKKMVTFPMELRDNKYYFCEEVFDTYDELLASFSEPKQNHFFLKECLPPREYDKSQLLLCCELPKTFGKQISADQLEEALKNTKSPLYIKPNHIIINRSSYVEKYMDKTETYRAYWNVDGDHNGKPFPVSFKTLKNDRYLKEFLDLANRMALVRSDFVAKLYGITLMSPTALVLESLPYGRLDIFLRDNRHRIEELKLLKTVVNLCRALWDLSEANCVHGNIRCCQLMLTHCDIDSFQMKLADPGLNTQYNEDDRHWIPVELFPMMSLACKSTMADVWAFATTAWEIFSYGQSPNYQPNAYTMKDYQSGIRLKRPSTCSVAVWETIQLCWSHDLHSRPNSQALLRDLSYYMHQNYIPAPRPIESTSSSYNDVSSDNSDRMICFGSGSTALIDQSTSELTSPPGYDEEEDLPPPPPILEMKGILQFEKVGQVQILNRIGHGHFGVVRKGLLEYYDSPNQQMVAVKELKRNESLENNERALSEIKDEIRIMKSLQHTNIVKILGVCDEGGEMMIVMEYIANGALESHLSFNRHLLGHKHLLTYAEQVAMGMEYLRVKNVVHRDLAARNILVVDEWNVKISDFGLARFTNCGKFYKHFTQQAVPIKWYAPEAVLRGLFSDKSDVWSYGVTLWEMFTYGTQEVPPYNQLDAENRANYFKMPEGCPSTVYQLMHDCWNREPERRPTFSTIVMRITELLQKGP